MTVIRRGRESDLEEIARLQSTSPEASQWKVTQYLQYEVRVAECGESRLAGFLVGRSLTPLESEILNLAVDPDFRRRGIARQLVKSFLEDHPGAVFLEVRASNETAQGFYKHLGFQQVSTRLRYYDSPPEAAIVMKFHSC